MSIINFIPSPDQFAAHGLLDISLDITSTSGQGHSTLRATSHQTIATSNTITGWATWKLSDLYPIIPGRTHASRVRFHFCPLGDPSSTSLFRRCAQLIALDTFTEARNSSVSGKSSPSNSTSVSEYSSSTLRYRPFSTILAWWEDSLGFWLILDEVPGEEKGLIESWRDIMGEDWPNQPQVQGSQREKWAQACHLLLNVAECLKAIHDKHLSMNWTHPTCFAVREKRVIVDNLSSTTALPTFTLSRFFDPSLTSSSLFTRDPIDSSSSQLSESYIFKYLRYLAPETAITRVVSPINDIYGWGVLAYELLTGATIDGGPDSPDLSDVDLLVDVHRHVTIEIPPAADYLRRLAEIGSLSPQLPPNQLSDIIMKALSKEPDERYHSFDALSYDLRKLSQITRSKGDFSKFNVGEVDRFSRFHLPPTVIERSGELQTLDDVLDAQRQDGSTPRVIDIWGVSGIGKSRLVEDWIRRAETREEEGTLLIGRAKLDEHLKKPLSSFVQIFQSLLDFVLTNPSEDPQEWIDKIRLAIGTQFSILLSILPQDSRRLLRQPTFRGVPLPDLEKFLAAFKVWSKKFLQLFATSNRPLVLVVDDTQWIPPDEVTIWQHLLDGLNPLNHVIVVSMTRTETPVQPPASTQLSISATSIHLSRLTEDGVASFISTCFNGRLASGWSTAASFIYGETGGSPLFLRTLITTLVKEQVIFFDYESLEWRFDLIRLQLHLSDSGVDAYIDRILRILPLDAQQLLMILSCLPSAGFPLKELSKLINKSTSDTSLLVDLISGMGAITMSAKMVRFTHDRQRSAAQRLIPQKDLAGMHQRVSNFLRGPDLYNDYLFDAVEHALKARDLGAPNEREEELVSLLLEAAKRAALSASFETAQSFINVAENVMTESGGIDEWMREHRAMCFRLAQTASEIASVLNLHEDSLSKLEQIRSRCNTASEEIRLVTLIVRQLISASQHIRAIEETLQMFRNLGYDPANPSAIDLWEPHSVEDVEELDKLLYSNTEPTEEEDELVLLMALLSFAGPTLYVSYGARSHQVFILGISLVKALGKLSDSTSYLIGIYAIISDNPPVQRSLYFLAHKTVDNYPSSFLTSSALVAVGAMAHCFGPLHDAALIMNSAFDSCLIQGDYEIGSYVFMLDMMDRIICRDPMAWNVISKRYNLIRPYLSAAHRVLVNLPLQYLECLAKDSSDAWIFDGVFVNVTDLETVKTLQLHMAVANAFSLGLQIYYDSSLEKQLELVESGIKISSAAHGMIGGLELHFFMAITTIRAGGDPQVVKDARKELLKFADWCDSWRYRLDFLTILELVESDPLCHLGEIEDVIDHLTNEHEFMLAGLLNYYTAINIQAITTSTKLAAGFVRGAFMCYRQAETFGLCSMLRQKYPGVCPILPSIIELPSQLVGVVTAAPPLRRASLSTSAETTTSSRSKEEERMEQSLAKDSLDTLTLMRSSLALAQEKDSTVLLCTLLRILCQSTRCDYAAIGLNDDEGQGSLRLRAAGPFQRITGCDISITDEVAPKLCPTTIMLHVARTGVAITQPSKLARLRADPFYANRPPRTILCLPIINQGVQSGVILLSSLSSVSATMQSDSAKEVVSTLATFATITHSHHTFAQRLTAEVEQRTRELSSALQAKTQFLSQCSHELRSPLAAIMGLAAVLEASPGLTGVQREHLRTIIASGEDLLSLISNILDHSKLESNSVTLEEIPFDLRTVVETALDTIAPVAQSKGIELSLNSAFVDDPPGMIGDPFRVKQVLLNLLSNAVKFTPPSIDKNGVRTAPKVTAKWHWEEIEDRIKVILDVSDTGVGIPSSKLHKLFKSFSQVDESITRSYGGSGLGLIISRDLARLLGGDCTVESEFGKGSTFTFSFTANKNPNYIRPPIKRFDKPQSVFVLCPRERPWADLLENDLVHLNCKPIRFNDEVSQTLVKDHPNGLNSSKDFSLILIDTAMIDFEIMKKMTSLQPRAKFIFLVQAIDLATEMSRLQISRDSIIARPIKFKSLYELVLPQTSIEERIDEEGGMVGGESKSSTQNTGRKHALNRRMALEKPLRILVVDDSPVNVSVCKRILELFGYKDTESVSDGQQAVEAAERSRFDLVLLDLQMPVLDGFGALARIKASPLAGDPCCVSLSANVDKATQEKCLTAGFFNCLTKPVDIPRLGEILGQVFDFKSSQASVMSPAERSCTITPPAIESPSMGRLPESGSDQMTRVGLGEMGAAETGSQMGSTSALEEVIAEVTMKMEQEELIEDGKSKKNIHTP